MKGIRIQFDSNGAFFNFSKPVEDFESIVQNALINTATLLGSDPVFESKGTNLLNDAVRGILIDENSATHSSNFAALDTLLFIQQEEPENSEIRLIQYELQPVQITQNGLQLNAVFTSNNGDTIGRSIEI